MLVLAVICACAGGNSQAQNQTQNQAQNQGQHLPPCDAQADDADGNGYGGADDSCLVTVESVAPPAIISPDTGAPAVLERVFWTVEDLHNKSIVCQLYDLRSGTGQYLPYDWEVFYNHFLDGDSSSIFLGSALEVIERPGSDPEVNFDDQWYLENGYYRGGSSALSASAYVEYSGNTFRFWQSQREYWSCRYTGEENQARPDSFPPTSNITDLYFVGCEDSVPLGDGWGWDGFGSCVYSDDESDDGFEANYRYVSADYVGATQQTLPLADAEPGCDYSNAEQQGGWGWNPISNMSCAPLVPITPVPVTPVPTTPVATDDTAAECIDSDGDGWGWNGTESCLVADTVDDQCDYSDADLYDGWGWNPVTRQSCAPVN